MLENLEAIRERGVEAFVDGEPHKWRCSRCGAVLCVHRAACLSYGEPNPHHPQRGTRQE